MGKNRSTNARHRVRQDLLRASGNIEWAFEHLQRCLVQYEDGQADTHAERSRLLLDLLTATKLAIDDLRNDT